MLTENQQPSQTEDIEIAEAPAQAVAAAHNDIIGDLLAQKAALNEQLNELTRKYMAGEISGAEKTVEGQHIETEVSMLDLRLNEELNRADGPGEQRRRGIGRLAARLFKQS